MTDLVDGDVRWLPGPPGREPRWDLNLAVGKDAEQRAWALFGALLNSSDRVRVEVKTKSYPDDSFYVELEQNPFHSGPRASGLNTCEADLWAVELSGSGCWFVAPVDLLRLMVADPGRLWGKNVEETDGDCPTRGRLLRIGTVLDFARRHPRWREHTTAVWEAP